ncbi:MAG: hypothetical protein QOI10_1868 [Solirubrobacterales bacterium]|jgi:hypothetical protein|nr:hypothetical protein [Solirubrobacterales bacterium]
MGLYLAWGVIGFIATFTVLYGFTPAGPVIVLLVWLAYRNLPTISGSRRPEAFGTLAGFGAFWLFVATTVDGDPAPFALVGAVALGVSMLSYLMGGRDRCVNDLSTG